MKKSKLFWVIASGLVFLFPYIAITQQTIKLSDSVMTAYNKQIWIIENSFDPDSIMDELKTAKVLLGPVKSSNLVEQIKVDKANLYMDKFIRIQKDIPLDKFGLKVLQGETSPILRPGYFLTVNESNDLQRDVLITFVVLLSLGICAWKFID